MRTNVGSDHQARVMADTASNGTGTCAPANYIALSTDTTAVAASDTTLAGELTANGLGRAQATYAHTTGASSYSLTKVFTSTDVTSRTVSKIGIFNASSVGILVFEANVTPQVVNNGDTLTVTETISI